MRNTFTTIVKATLIFAATLCLATQAQARPREHDSDFRVTHRYQETITADTPAVWKDRGIRISARPVFVHGATTTAGAVTGFDVSIDYEPDDGDPEVWLLHEFIGNRSGNEVEFGPFINTKGTGFIIEIHVHSSKTDARLEFRLASDGIVIRDEILGGPPGFSLYYATKPIPEIKLAKEVYSYYSNVTFVVDLLKFATGTTAPEAFVVALLIGVVQDQIVALIPDDYRGLVGYSCNRCGHRAKLSDFSGCLDLECPSCDNEAAICFRSIDLDIELTP